MSSQTFPVHITAQLSPPYSAYLPDYADPSSEKLKIIIQFNDFSVPQYHLKLRFEIKGNGFTLSTKTFFNPGPVIVYPGQPLLLAGPDVATYLNSNNLDFTGINQSTYEQRMALPEGYYSICVKAYDYFNNSPIEVSNEACANAWFTQSDPPFLNLPICGSVIKPLTPQNILFQWTPMNLGSPNSATNTVYEFALWECRPDSNANPNQVVLSTSPVFSTTTDQTFLNYGLAETPLNLYMKYIWRVRAKDNSGRDLFKNQGYSQICTFKYGSPSNVLGDVIKLNLNAQAINHRNGQCDWNRQSLFTNYLLQVRKQGTQYWFDYPNVSGVERVTNLEPKTIYECRVRGEGNGLTGEWSNTAVFTTPDLPQYSCNDQSNPYNVAPGDPLPFIKAIRGLVFASGQFEVTTTYIEPSGSTGWYKGRGHVRFLGKRIPVKWDNIFIDAEARHQQGVIDALTNGIDKWLNAWDIKIAEDNAIYTNGIITNVSVNGNQVCYTLQGSNTPICVPSPTNANSMVIRDGEGNQYNITFIPAPATVSGPINYLNYSADSLDANENRMITFKTSTSQNYGFDEKQYAAFINNYEVIKLKNGKNYFVPNKSIGEGWSDEVLADIQISDFNPLLLSFKKRDGTLLTVSHTVTPAQWKVTGIPADAGCIYAWYASKKIGKLNITSVKELSKKLVLVPVNGSATNLVSDQLNSVFKQANVSWSVQTVSNFTFDLGNDGLEVADANLLTKYSGEMKSLRNAYIKYDSLYDKSAYYLFVVPAFSDPAMKGYMVRGKSLGFISANASVKQIAHELGHGAFGLEHTFPSLTKGSSNNLMDYTDGTQMVKDQWAQIQFGKFSNTWFDEEEDASINLLDLLDKEKSATAVFYWINKARLSYKNANVFSIPATPDYTAVANSCYLGGVQYDFIKLRIPTKNVEVSANAYNKVTTFTAVTRQSYTDPAITIGGVSIDEKLYFYVPLDRMNNLKYYIQNTQSFKNLLLFVNGYRPVVNFNGDQFASAMEYVDSDNEIEFGDSRGYWKGIDAQFMNRIGTRTAVYVDGHHSVGTSNHLTTAKYTGANVYALFAQKNCTGIGNNGAICSEKWYLHTEPNVGGFLKRHNSGDAAAQDMIRKINSGQIVFDKNSDTLDIVAHSMGYAYAVGMIKRLASAGIHFGRFYIIAPENACSGGCDWSLFTEVWQYGANEKLCPPYNQDGVAPQCMADGLSQRPVTTKGGRVFIPDDWPGQGFLGSHSISGYGWIFNKKSNESGYVKPR